MQLKTWLQNTIIIEFYIIFHYKGAQNLVAQHYERDFDLIFCLKADQNLVVEHCEWDCYMIFHFKEAEHLVAEHYERFWHDFSTLWWLKKWLQSNVEEDGLTPMTMNKNRFNLVDSVLDNFTMKEG